ncbi:succinate dehydrogenase, hydrophobic membrane anchor protein [Beggiatoa alba]|nr:succinate dehydrogenase, hydrophobic membrane anchor protein [Beggiatoa alba]
MSWRASSGLRSWLLQRLTAVYILLFLVVFAGLWSGQTITFETWHAWVAHPAANVALLLFIFALLTHAWIGGRDVLMDYVTSVVIRYVLLVGFALSLLVLGVWSLRIVLLVSEGSSTV